MAEKLEQSIQNKDTANGYFKVKDYPQALKYYHMALLAVKGLLGKSPEQVKAIKDQMLAIKNNMVGPNTSICAHPSGICIFAD